MSSSATGVGMTICFLGAILLILTQKSSQKFGDVLGIMRLLSIKKATSSTKAFFMPSAVIVYCDSPFCMWMTVFSINFCFLL